MKKKRLSEANLFTNKFFDELPIITEEPESLDWPVIKKLFQEEANKKITKQHAQNIGILVQQNNALFPSNGGTILFGKNRLRYFPDAIIRCARFLSSAEFLDSLDIETYPPLALQEALNFIRRNKEIHEYLHAALREAIINAIVHTDYTVKGAHITIAIFDDRIEITNPGSLPIGITTQNALMGASKIRNRAITNVFRHLGWIEQWGTGLQRIIKTCAQTGLKEPVFEATRVHFRVTLCLAP